MWPWKSTKQGEVCFFWFDDLIKQTNKAKILLPSTWPSHFLEKILILENSRNLFPQKWFSMKSYSSVIWKLLENLGHEDMCLLRGVPTHIPQGYSPSSFLLWEGSGIVTAADNRFHQACNHPPVTSEVKLGARGKGLNITVLAKFVVTIPITQGSQSFFFFKEINCSLWNRKFHQEWWCTPSSTGEPGAGRSQGQPRLQS